MPNDARTTPLAAAMAPWLGVAETKESPAGRGKFTKVFAAAAGPKLKMVKP